MSIVWYPVSYKHKDTTSEDVVLLQKMSDLAHTGRWAHLFQALEEERDILEYENMINNSLILPDTPGPSFRTVLHEAALTSSSKEVFERLLSFKASRSLKTSDGETAYDIAKRRNLDDGILTLLAFSCNTTEDDQAIKNMEDGLHKLMRSRVAKLLDENEVCLPQLSYLYEFGRFHYEVPRWLGGFNVEINDKGILVDSFCRVVGGSEETHIIDRSGNIELIAAGYD